MRVYYNSRCPVCDAGIRSQRRRMERSGAPDVEWRDINLEPDALLSHGATLDDVRRRLHVIDDAGRVHVGADAFAALWRATPGQKWLARLLAPAVARRAANVVYDRFADWLFGWNQRKGRW